MEHERPVLNSSLFLSWPIIALNGYPEAFEILPTLSAKSIYVGS